MPAKLRAVRQRVQVDRRRAPVGEAVANRPALLLLLDLRRPGGDQHLLHLGVGQPGLGRDATDRAGSTQPRAVPAADRCIAHPADRAVDEAAQPVVGDLGRRGIAAWLGPRRRLGDLQDQRQQPVRPGGDVRLVDDGVAGGRRHDDVAARAADIDTGRNALAVLDVAHAVDVAKQPVFPRHHGVGRDLG